VGGVGWDRVVEKGWVGDNRRARSGIGMCIRSEGGKAGRSARAVNLGNLV
jgi:hypothetical protein